MSDPAPAPNPSSAPSASVGNRPLTDRDVHRLLWRAGFGPKRGQRAAYVGRAADAVVRFVTRTSDTCPRSRSPARTAPDMLPTPSIAITGRAADVGESVVGCTREVYVGGHRAPGGRSPGGYAGQIDHAEGELP